MRRNLRFWLGILVSVFFLYLALKGQRLEQVWQDITEVNYLWLIPAVGVYFVAVALRTYRWHLLLRPIKSISTVSLFPTIIIGYMGNNIFPLRAGEFIRAYVLKRKEAVSGTAAFATILVERILDGIIMLIFIFTVLPLVPVSKGLERPLALTSLLFFGTLALFLIIASSPNRIEGLYHKTLRRFLPERFQEATLGILDRFLEGLKVLRSGYHMLLILALSFLLWLAEASVYLVVMQGFPFRVPFHAILFTTAIVNLVTTIPSSAGYLGTFEWSGIQSLALFGVMSRIATSFILVTHATIWLPPTVLGLWFMWRESLGWQELGSVPARAMQE